MAIFILLRVCSHITLYITYYSVWKFEEIPFGFWRSGMSRWFLSKSARQYRNAGNIFCNVLFFCFDSKVCRSEMANKIEKNYLIWYI